jgi:hypothetical protein
MRGHGARRIPLSKAVPIPPLGVRSAEADVNCSTLPYLPNL